MRRREKSITKFFKCTLAVAGVAQWTERWPANWKITGSIPSQGTHLGRGPSPQLAGG